MDFNAIAAKVERLLSSHPLDGWELVFSASRNLSIEVRESKVDTFKCSAPTGVSVRVLKEGGMGFAYSTSMDESDLSRMVDNALVAAQAQTPDEHYAFPSRATFPELAGLLDEHLPGIQEEEKIKRTLALERIALEADPRIKRVRKATYGESRYEVHLRNSNGVDGYYGGTSVSSSVTAVAEENGDSQMGWDFGFSPRYSDVHVDAIAHNAAARATGLLGARRIPTMRCPVVLDNHVASDILEVLAPSFLAENVQKGKSMLAGKVGEKLFSPLLLIHDSGLLPGGMGTAPFDAEGVPQQDTLLASDGIIRAFLYDTLRGRKEGKPSTGNAVKGGIKSPPHNGVTNFFIENGDLSQTRLLAGLDRCVLITDVLGMHTANPVSGDFSVGATGFLVEKGKRLHPVKGIAISGNILDLFRRVEAVGNDLRFFGSVGSPSLLIGELDVSGD